jgi:fructokinase
MENKNKVVVGIEIGGTNIKVAIAPAYNDVSHIVDLLTSGNIQVKDLKTRKNPADTVKEIAEWILKENNLDSSQIQNVYISNFGPIELNKKSKDYGLILNTPKLGWKDFNVVKSFAEQLNLFKDQLKVDLDVSCAAFLEHKLGKHK